MDHRDGRQVSEASVTEAKYESLWGGKLLVPSSPSFVLYWAPAVCLGIVGTQWFFVESINECTNSYSINVWWELIVCLKASLSSSSKYIHVVRPGAVILLWKIWYQIMEMWSPISWQVQEIERWMRHDLSYMSQAWNIDSPGVGDSVRCWAFASHQEAKFRKQVLVGDLGERNTDRVPWVF